jgi:hypothetical protein
MTSTCQFIASTVGQRVELAEAVLRERGEIQPQLRVLLTLGQRRRGNRSGYGHRTSQ